MMQFVFPHLVQGVISDIRCMNLPLIRAWREARLAYDWRPEIAGSGVVMCPARGYRMTCCFPAAVY
jgi:hypothetical protein